VGRPGRERIGLEPFKRWRGGGGTKRASPAADEQRREGHLAHADAALGEEVSTGDLPEFGEVSRGSLIAGHVVSQRSMGVPPMSLFESENMGSGAQCYEIILL
jgi:hypothetical protein